MLRNKSYVLATALLVAFAVTIGACSDQASIVGPEGSGASFDRGGMTNPGTVTETVTDWQTCPNTGTGDPAWTKIDNATGAGSGAYGSFSYTGLFFNYDINAGWTLEFCIKFATNVVVYTVEGADAGAIGPLSNAISHTAWRIIEEPPVEELQALSVSKGADASYDRTVEWELEKKVNGQESVEFSGAPGDEFNVTWEIEITKSETSDNYYVEGDIVVGNPNSVDVVISIADVLDDGTVATVNCPSYTVPASGTLECTYEAYPSDASATLNTATVTVESYTPPPNAIGDITGGIATAPVSFIENLIGFDEGTLTDDRFPLYSEVFAASGTETFNETFECPEDLNEYDEFGLCVKVYVNTATLTFEDDSYLDDSATVTLTCSGLYGCTPGFWKQEHHFGHWGPTGYLPSDLINSVFAGSMYGESTLVEALDFGGGGGIAGAQRNLLRAAVASLLNFAHPDVAYAIPGQVAITDAASLIAAVNAALASGDRQQMLALATMLDDANNAVNLCALSGRSFLD